jgi:hypothetical protein
MAVECSSSRGDGMGWDGMGVERCPGFHVAIDNELMLLASFDLSELDVLLLLLSDSFPFFQFITRLLLRSWRKKKKERNKKEEKFVSFFFFLSKVVTKQKDFFSFRSFLLCNFFILFYFFLKGKTQK